MKEAIKNIIKSNLEKYDTKQNGYNKFFFN